jgi:hypothetical protein
MSGTAPPVPDAAEMNLRAAEAAEKVEAAAAAAEAAAARAEKAAARPKYWLIGGLSFGLVGAVLAFALEDSDASVLGVSLQPLGGVLFATGVLLVGASAVASMGDGDGGNGNATTVKSVGGLIAVVVGITAVSALTIVTLTQLGDKSSSIVAVTSSAFGIISAVVGAYLGIKITAESTEKASDQVKAAAVSEHVANEATNKLGAVKKVGLTPEQAVALEAETNGVEGTTRTPDSHLGGGEA